MNTNPLYNKLLERLVTERPDLMPYMELFQEATKSSSSESSEIQKQKLAEKYRRLFAAAKLLEEDLEEAMQELDDLARALGACEECWGDDLRCSKCRGKGSPGYFTPKRDLFDRL